MSRRVDSGGRTTGVVVWGVVVGTATLWAARGGSGRWALAGALAVGVALIWWIGVTKPLRSAGGDTMSGTALLMSILGLATCVVYWSGLPLVLGATALYLAVRARREDGGPRGKAIAAFWLSTLPLAVGVMTFVGWVDGIVTGS